MNEEILIDVRLSEADNDKQVDNLTKSITALRKENEALIKSNKDLSKAGQENSKEYVDNTKQLEINKQKISDNTASRKGLIQAIVSEDNSIKALRVRNAELIKQRDQITTTTAQGRMEIARYNAVIDQNNEIIRKNTSIQEQQRQNVGNYTDSIREAIGNSGQFGQATIGLTDSLISLVNPITAAIAGGTALFKAYTSSTIGARDLAKAQDLVSSAFDIANEAVGSFISQLTGSGGKGVLESFADEVLFRIAPALQTLAAFSAQAKERLRDLEISEKFAQQFAKDYERQAELQRRIRDDETKSIDERVNAANKVNDFLETSAQRSIIVWNAQIEAIKTSTINYDNNREAQLRVREIEAEIADKREEITGKLTENVTALAELRKQFDEEQELRDRRAIETENELLSVKEYNFQREMEMLSESEAAAQASIERIASIRADQRQQQETDQKKAEGEYKKNVKAREIAETDLSNRIQALKRQELDQASFAADALAANFKKGSDAQKTAAFASVIFSTGSGVAKAVEAGAGIPWPGNLAAILSGVAAVLGGIAQARAVLKGYAQGGLVMAKEAWESIKGYARGGSVSGQKIGPQHGTPTTRSNGDNRVVTVRTGEVILNEHQQAALGGSETFRRIGVPGFATGGAVGDIPVQSFAESMATRTAMNRINSTPAQQTKYIPVLVYQDFEMKAAEINSPITRAKVI